MTPRFYTLFWSPWAPHYVHIQSDKALINIKWRQRYTGPKGLPIKTQSCVPSLAEAEGAVSIPISAQVPL